MNISAMDQGVLGMQRGMQGMHRASEQIAAGNLDQAALVEAMISLKAQATVVSASAHVVQVTDDMLGAVLDIFA
jgi:hypothetical protein